MAYTSWSVVFGEQPSAAKWNLLGSNDASFNNGTGLPSAGSAVSNVAASETSTSTSYAALSTAQAVTVTVGTTGLLLIGIGATNVKNNTAAAFTYMTFVLSGANTLAAADTYSAEFQSVSANQEGSVNRTVTFSGLTPGSTTVTVNVKVQTGGAGAGTGTWVNRHLFAIPL